MISLKKLEKMYPNIGDLVNFGSKTRLASDGHWPYEKCVKFSNKPGIIIAYAGNTFPFLKDDNCYLLYSRWTILSCNELVDAFMFQLANSEDIYEELNYDKI